MKEIDKKYICYYCIGCNAEESDNFIQRYNCKNFVSGYENWAELRRKTNYKKSIVFLKKIKKIFNIKNGITNKQILGIKFAGKIW